MKRTQQRADKQRDNDERVPSVPLQRILIPLLFCALFVKAQSAATLYQDLQKLNFLGSVLYVAAHPDDENTALISHFANHVHADAAYLSLTRGDGGQNLIGTELREQLGVIRTNELLAARSIDGGQQFFSSAIDFGYSKHPDETLQIWDKKQILGEVVARIRAFQPDLIIHRFDHRTPGRTHGHHTASALLSFEAFDLTNDPKSYPEQLKQYEPWQAKRQFFNTSWWFYGSQERFEKADKTNLLALEIGNYDPLLGLSNSQLAASSRSSHKSQGFGSAPRLGSQTEYIELIHGDRPKGNDPFEGIDTSWNRVAGGDKVGKLVASALAEFDFTAPSKSLNRLIEIHQAINRLSPSVWKTRKRQAVEKLIKSCMGLTLQLNSERPYGVTGESLSVVFNGVQQSHHSVVIEKIGEVVIQQSLKSSQAFSKSFRIPVKEELTTPYWLTQKGSLGSFKITNETLRGLPVTPPLIVPIRLKINGTPLVWQETIQYRITDPVRGEVVTPFYILPSLGVNFQKNVHLFPNQGPQRIQLEVTNYGKAFSGEVELHSPDGWQIDQAKKPIVLNQRGSAAFISYELHPTQKAKSGILKPLVHQKGKTLSPYTVQQIDYDHIPKQYIAQPSEARLVRLDLSLPNKKVGYIMGAGDLVAKNLEAIGLPIERIDLETATQENLNSYDTILLGIRAYNVLESLVYKNQLLFDFAQQGGTLVIQYTTSRRMKTKKILPYPIQLSRDRVTDENSPVRMLQPNHPIFNNPHQITSEDFDGWVQERGLYFANEWDTAYTPLLGMQDPGENEKKGSLLVAAHGKGKVIYTGLSFFRELPAGVPGAYRLLLNLINY